MNVVKATFLGHDVELDITDDLEDKEFFKEFDLPEGFTVEFDRKSYSRNSYSLAVTLTDSDGEIVSKYADHSIGRDEVTQRFLELGMGSLENVEVDIERIKRRTIKWG